MTTATECDYDVQVKEVPDVEAERSIDQLLAQADQKLVKGRLSDAADLLEQGLKGTSIPPPQEELWTY